MASPRAYAEEDIGNIQLLEHVNLTIPDQPTAMVFYILGLGFTRDPYMNVGLGNMWINLGEQQFHLPTRIVGYLDPNGLRVAQGAQVLPGHIGLVVPSLDALEERLRGVERQLEGSRFAWSRAADHVAVTCPWGNQFRCYGAGPAYEGMRIGMPYVDVAVRRGAAAGIARFYEKVMHAPTSVEKQNGTATARTQVGRAQQLIFRETEGDLPPYDGHHIAVYVADFSGPYAFMGEHDLLTEEVRNHQFRFVDIVDPKTGERLHQLEHEVRSLRHPMYRRVMVNRDATQAMATYRRGGDALSMAAV